MTTIDSFFPALSLLFFFIFLLMGFSGAPLFLWGVFSFALAFIYKIPLVFTVPLALVFLIFLLRPLRRTLLSRSIMNLLNHFKLIPQISKTERTALEAGVVWVEKDLFSGKPDLNKILREPYPSLTAEEEAFMQGPLLELCRLIDDWQIWKDRDFPQAVWDYIKKEKFWGMIIPKEYGGLGFSHTAHSQVIMTLGSRSAPVAVTVMVPNSLGPAELLIHYGTDEQKSYYLPRLARGEEVPCFALTEPTAGSDAASLKAEGVLFKGEDGELYIRLQWNKRWITLAAISTLLGVAFRLKDPQNYLGKGEDVGITCALIPADTEGVILGRRHDPLTVPFYNCPTQGKDVVIHSKQIIGGIPQAGNGWTMLMESLSVGRGISLPAQATGQAKLVTRVTSSHAYLRKQFNMPIGQFEGVQEPLSEMGLITYILESMRRFTLGALDQGIKPPVITAMAKYNGTELARRLLAHGMDIMGGTGITLGPKNLIAHHYMALPIGVTVEGANILTRTLIIFGQGAFRAHPYAFQEVKALEDKNLKLFDEVFWAHIGHVIRNFFRSVLMSVTRGRMQTFLFSGKILGADQELLGGHKKMMNYARKLSWCSATFSLMSDVAMGSLGGKLKQKEMITGLFADILSWMYMSSCILRRFIADGKKDEDTVVAEASLQYAFDRLQESFNQLYFSLLPQKGWVKIFTRPIWWWVRMNRFVHPISEETKINIAQRMMGMTEKTAEGGLRDKLTRDGIYLPPLTASEHLAQLEQTFQVVKKAEAVENKIKKAVKKKLIPAVKSKDGSQLQQLIKKAVEEKIISQEEAVLLHKAEEMRNSIIQVDDFSVEEYRRS